MRFANSHLTRFVIALFAVGAIIASLIFTHAFEHLTRKLWLAVLIVQPIGALAVLFVAIRLSFLARPQVGIWPAAKAQSLSLLILYLLPSRLSEFVKPLYLTDRCGIPLSRILAAVFCERITDIFIVAVAAISSVVYLARPMMQSALPYWAMIAAAAIIVSAVLIFYPQILDRLINLLPGARLKAVLGRLLAEVHAVLTPQNIVVSLLLGALAWLFSYLTTYGLLMFAGSIALTPGSAMVVFLAGTIGLIVGVAPGGLGTFEGGIVLALGHFGYGLGEALALAIGLRIAALILPGGIALWVLARERTGLGAFLQRVRALFAANGQPQDEARGKTGGTG